MLTPGQLFTEAQTLADAEHAAVDRTDRHALALALFFQGYTAGQACHKAFVELEDTDGALQMLARHRLAATPTPPTLSEDLREASVTQEDREAAASLIAARPLADNVDIIRHAGADDGGFVQAFARHRIASSRPVKSDNGYVFYGPDGHWHWSKIHDNHESIEDQRPATLLEKYLFNAIRNTTENLGKEVAAEALATQPATSQVQS